MPPLDVPGDPLVGADERTLIVEPLEVELGQTLSA